MKKNQIKYLKHQINFLFCLLTSSVFANDFTGTYQCEGNDGSEGA